MSVIEYLGEFWPAIVLGMIFVIGYLWKIDNIDNRLRKIERERELRKLTGKEP